jgi:hypothetical protein
LEITAEPGIEIRRIVLLTRLRDTAKGMTMTQLVRDCSRVAGWSIAGHSLRDGVRFVLQTLIDDKLVAARARFVITSKGQEYLEDPLKWRVEVETREHVEENVFWKNILAVFDKAYSKLRTTTKNLTSSVSQQQGEPETTDSS